MAFLLDSNIFIQAARLHYGMDFCPAFWEWLVVANEAGKVFSIEQVADEIDRGDDDLTDWAKERGEGFFLPADESMLATLPVVAEWVQAQAYTPAAINTFFQDADYYPVAFALAHGHTVVAHEVSSNGVKRVKIPNVCLGVGFKNVNPFSMLRTEHARFILGHASSAV